MNHLVTLPHTRHLFLMGTYCHQSYHSFYKHIFFLYSRDLKMISKAEYKSLLDQSVKLYRLKDKVSRLEETEHSSKAKMARMEKNLKAKANEIKKLQRLINSYKEERATQKDNDNQSKDVRNLFSALNA